MVLWGARTLLRIDGGPLKMASYFLAPFSVIQGKIQLKLEFVIDLICNVHFKTPS